MSENRVIGTENSMPWHISEDFRYFKRVTMGKPVVMGRKTFESIGKLLPGRTNIILTRDRDYECEGAIVATSYEEALERAESAFEKGSGDSKEVMIIGGGEIYRLALPEADRLYLTEIHARFNGDATFPELGAEWQLKTSDGPHTDAKSQLAYTWKVFERE